MQASKPTALVVDDDPALRMLIRVNLELEGFDVVEAGTVSDADVAVRDAKPAVVLLDMHLGGHTTVDLLERLRAERIPVAIVTGSVDVHEYRTAADAVLSKPFTPQDLVAVARRLARVDA